MRSDPARSSGTQLLGTAIIKSLHSPNSIKSTGALWQKRAPLNVHDVPTASSLVPGMAQSHLQHRAKDFLKKISFAVDEAGSGAIFVSRWKRGFNGERQMKLVLADFGTEIGTHFVPVYRAVAFGEGGLNRSAPG